MQPVYYIALNVHKRKISYCVKDSGGQVYAEGAIPATRFDLDRWMKTLPLLHLRSSAARRESSCPLDKDLSWKSPYR
jgi:hypothetical protein